MTLETGASRFTFVDKAQMAPAQCVLTGQITELIDLHRDIPMYGRLYISKDAVAELARVAGLEASTTATMQQQEWYAQGYQDAVEKDFDGTLARLIGELGAIAARRVADLEPAQADDSDAGEPDEEPADSGDDLRGPDEGLALDKRETGSTGGSKRRGSVQRPSVDAAFQL